MKIIRNTYIDSWIGGVLVTALLMTLLPVVSGCPPPPDVDEDGYTEDVDCDDLDPLTHPGAEELANLKDNNCNGFGDEPPCGFSRVDQSTQGFAGAVAWYEDYLYLAAGSIVQVYDTEPGPRPELVYEVEYRDWVRQLVVAGDHLFVAARGDGVAALDLTDPAHPGRAGHVRGLFDVAEEYTDVEALFHGVDARWDEEEGRYLVAVANGNAAPKSWGGVDAVVFEYDPATDAFTLVAAFGTESRSNPGTQVPLTVGITETSPPDRGLYIGYGWPTITLIPPFFDGYGEIAYVPIDTPGPSLNLSGIGAVMDIKTRGDKAFAALSKSIFLGECSIFSRIRIAGEGPGRHLAQDVIMTVEFPGGTGGYVDIHGDFMAFGTWIVGRSKEGYNLWTFTDLDRMDEDPFQLPTPAGEAGTLDWIFQLACRDSGPDSRWVYVADEWGGLEMWKSDEAGLTLDFDDHRIATGMFSIGMWNDDTTVYSVKEGSGLWVFDTFAPDDEQVAVELIDRSDPGCDELCEHYCPPPAEDEKCCCPPEEGAWPFPPAVFVSSGASSQGRVALLAQDRNTAVPGGTYFMLFEEDELDDGYEYTCIFSEPISPGCWSGNRVMVEGEILFVTLKDVGFDPTNEVSLYHHCSAPEGEYDEVTFLGAVSLPVPVPADGLWTITDIAAHGDYLFVSEVHIIPLSVPDSGLIHVFRWREGALATCADPTPPSLLDPPEHIGSFCMTLTEGFIPNRLVVDAARDRLIVGCRSYYLWPIRPGALLFYDDITGCLEDPGTCFDPESAGFIEAGRTDHTPADSIRVTATHANIFDVLINGDDMYVADFDNGLYKYLLTEGVEKAQVVGFYPAHRGSASEPFTPHRVLSPEDVVPLHHPIALGRVPSTGNIVVQENMSSRVSILSEEWGGKISPWRSK